MLDGGAGGRAQRRLIMERRIVFISARQVDNEPRRSRICSAFFSNDDRSVWVDGARFQRIARWPDANFREVVTRRVWWIAPPRFVGLHAPFEYDPPTVDDEVAEEFAQYMLGSRLTKRSVPFNAP